MNKKLQTGRREFLMGVAAGVGFGGVTGSAARISQTRGPTTVSDAIEIILQAIPTPPVPDTVDTIKAGDGEGILKGIATTFLPTCPVIRRTAELGANLLIAHEPVYYNHRDETDWLAGDPVFDSKRKLLEDTGVVIWRFHDYWHRHDPDGILHGLLESFGWLERERGEHPNIVVLSPIPLQELAGTLAQRLESPHVRFVGSPEHRCHRVGVLPGSYGSRLQMEFLRNREVDALIVGEINEWETNMYVADSLCSERPLGLIVLGHSHSEEPGMRYLAEWLRPRFPGIPVHHVPMPDVLQRT